MSNHLGIREESAQTLIEAENYSITTKQQADDSGLMLQQIKKIQKKIDELFDDSLKQTKAAYEAIKEAKGDLKKPTEAAEKIIRNKLAEYLARVAKEQREAMDALKEQGKELPPAEYKPRIEGVTQYKVKDFEIVSEKDIPENYWIRELDTKKIRAAVVAGIDIPGVRVFERTETRVKPGARG